MGTSVVESHINYQLDIFSSLQLNTMLTIRTAILLAVSAIVAVQGYEKTPMGTTCAKRVLEIKKEKKCIQACAELGYQYLGSWDEAGDFPACTFTEGLNKVCHFNTNKNPGRTDVNPKYSAICKECKDKKPEKTCQNAGILKINARIRNGQGGTVWLHVLSVILMLLLMTARNSKNQFKEAFATLKITSYQQKETA